MTSQPSSLEDEIASNRHAVVLVSGGLDSATVLALAQAQGFVCHALCVEYGQRHQAEFSILGLMLNSLHLWDLFIWMILA